MARPLGKILGDENAGEIVGSELGVALDGDLRAALALLDRNNLRHPGNFARTGVNRAREFAETDFDAFFDGDLDIDPAAAERSGNIGALIADPGRIAEISGGRNTDALRKDDVSAAETGDIGFNAIRVGHFEKIDLREGGGDFGGIARVGELQDGEI